VVVNPRALFKYGVDNAYGGGESAFLDIINAKRGGVEWPCTLGAMRFPDSGKFPDLYHSPKIEILRIGNLGK
jgi:hypothetical protein